MCWWGGYHLFFHYGQEFLPGFVELPILIVGDIVDATIRQPVRYG